MQFGTTSRPAHSAVSLRIHRHGPGERLHPLALRACGLLLFHVLVSGIPAHAQAQTVNTFVSNIDQSKRSSESRDATEMKAMQPKITISADQSPFAAGADNLTFTLTREGATTDELEATVTLTQDENWLSDLSHIVTFAESASTGTLVLRARDFSNTVSTSGNLVATVEAVTDYDVSEATATVRVISQTGPAVKISLDRRMYTFAENGADPKVVIVAKAATGIERIGIPIRVSLTANAGTANPPEDYAAISDIVSIEPSDYELENGVLVGRVEYSLDIKNDGVDEGEETFDLKLEISPGFPSEAGLTLPDGTPCGDGCTGTNAYRVNIIDEAPEAPNSPPPATLIKRTPDPPLYLRNAPGNAQVTLTWGPPFYDTGDITGYAYRYKESDQVFGFDVPKTWSDIPGGVNARSYTVTCLTNGLEYTFEVRAENANGGGTPAYTIVKLPLSGGQSAGIGDPASVGTESGELPTEAALLGNYPNPFNPETTIDYDLPQTSNVRLTVYDLLGHEVTVLVDGLQSSGRHTVRFHAGSLPSGTYVYRLEAGDTMVTRSMTLVK